MTGIRAGRARVERVPGSIVRVLAVRHAVPDVRAACGWYEALGFAVEHGRSDAEEAHATIRLAGGAIELVEQTHHDTGPGVVGLTLGTDDVGAAAVALSGAGIATSGPRTAPSTVGGPQPVLTRSLVVDGGDPARPGFLPEGRLEIAEGAPADAPLEHPNGATRLRALRLCVPLGAVGHTADRYARLLDRWPRVDGPRATFDLAGTSIVIGDADGLAAGPPDGPPVVRPAYLGLVVAVPAPSDAGRRGSEAFGVELAFAPPV